MDGKPAKGGGLMGVSLDEIQAAPVIIAKKPKKKRKKKKSALMKAVESAIPVKSDYSTEVI